MIRGLIAVVYIYYIFLNLIKQFLICLYKYNISQYLQESYDRTKVLLLAHKNELQLLADALVRYETLDADEVKLVIEGKDPRDPKSHTDKEKERTKSKIDKLDKQPTFQVI